MGSVSVRYRVDLGDACAVGPGKIALLEAIARSGSLSQAARDLGMSYRRGWLLLDSLNTAFLEPVADTSTGGRGGGGARLTPFGLELVTAYRKVEQELDKRAEAVFASFEERLRPPSRPALPRHRLQKPVAPARAARR